MWLKPFAVLACVLSAPLWAQTITVGAGRQPQLLLPVSDMSEAVCWHADKRYSAGARLLQGEEWLECVPVNAYQSNSPLRWQGLGEAATRERPMISVQPQSDKSAVIRVGP
ncbi:MAG: DUF1496 domain-containing protein [Aeromonas sp.]